MAGVKPYCYDCRKNVRSLIEHRTTATHKAARTGIRSSGPKGSHPYREPMHVGSQADYDYMLEERALDALPPTVDALFPTEIRDPLPEPAPAVRGSMPDPCEKCGKTFKTPAGARWHATNNRDCERWQARPAGAARTAYAQA